MDGGLSGLLVVCTAAVVLLKPTDLPIFARAGGRLVGAGVRALRRGREAALAAASESGAASEGSRARAASAIRAVDALASRLRREVAPLSLSPRAFADGGGAAGGKGGRRGAALRADVIKPTVVAGIAAATRDADTARGVAMRSVVAQAAAGDGTPPCGADIVASCIEESAFADQQAKILGKHVANAPSSKNVNQTAGQVV